MQYMINTIQFWKIQGIVEIYVCVGAEKHTEKYGEVQICSNR